MDFYEVLDQVIDLLRSRGRMSYRALKRQFDVDDDYIEDLKEEIIYSQRLAVDEDGRVLVWSGETEGVPEPTSTSTVSAQQPIEQQDQPTQVELPPEPPTPDAERRQLTVMFSDLVESTKLSGQLDPEDYREVLRAYQSTCSEVIQRFDGYIAQHLGDALLVYFGFPQAHEDDAHRGILAGLGMLEAMKSLNIRLQQDKGIRLAIRVGIHTGLTVVGEVGSGQKHELLALGEAPNVASRIQGLAEPDTIAISAATYRLVEGYFTVENLGLHTLKGVSEPQQVYRILRESDTQSRLEIAATRGLTPLVGRESEVTLLLDRWNQVKDGQGQVVLLSGEGGIGKSRLVQVVKDHVASEEHTRLECRSSPYFQNSALYPMTDLLERTLQFERDDSPEDKLAKLEGMLNQYRLAVEETVPLFATLLSIPTPEERYPPLNWTPQRQRQKTLEAIVAILLEQAEQQPVLFILEDLHWTDPTTLEFLDLLIDQVPAASILTLLTCRSTFQPTWSSRSYLTQVTLNRLSRNQIIGMAEQVADGKHLPAEVLQQIVEKTDGVPLFVEEMTKAVLESGMLKETNEHYELTGSLSTLAIPATLQDSLMARLDRLITAKGIAQYAAVIGRQFSYELLQAVSQLDEMTLQRELGRLVEAELVYQRGLPPHAMYLFKHALVTDIAYQSLLKSTRQHYHQRIAQVLHERFPETAETQPELLAHHYTEAALNEQAVGYWQKAGENAVQRSAHVEAIGHLHQALALLTTLPETSEHLQQELDVLIKLGPVLMSTKGRAAPEVEQVYTRARALCQHMEGSQRLFPVLVGLRRFYNIRGRLQIANEFAEQLLSLARQMHNHAYLLEAHSALGINCCFLGEFARSSEHLMQGMALYEAQEHGSLGFHSGIDLGVHCLTWLAMAHLELGYPDQAIRRMNEALQLAYELGHPFSLARVFLTTAHLHQRRREAHMTQEKAEEGIALCTEQGFAQYRAWGVTMRGWSLAAQGQAAEGIEQMSQGIADWRATGAEASVPLWLAWLAEAYSVTGQIGDGLRTLSEALALVDKTDDRWSEAELHRLQGELLLQQSPDNQTEAESCYQKAITIAQNQSAKSFELRAATSLARLWQQQGKRQDAHDLLAPVYEWFTEGFDTADLQEAKALLNDLT
jgi:class 3 adenylate cyclase/predicted ATPase